MNDEKTITIMIASNGFFLEAGEGRELFATKESLVNWLNANLPVFQEADPRLLALQKTAADG